MYRAREKISKKIGRLFLISFLCLTGIMLLFLSVEYRKYELILEDQQVLSDSTLNRLLESSNSSFKNVVFKVYSRWDKLHSFIENPDSSFASRNLDILTSDYDYDFVWVLDENGLPLYAVNRYDKQRFRRFPVDIKHLEYKDRFHFFHKYENEQLIEVIGSVVESPQHDNKRSGYFILGRTWDRQYIEMLSGISSGAIGLQLLDNPGKSCSVVRSQGLETRSGKNLYSYNDIPLAQVTFKLDNPILKRFLNLGIINIGVFILFSFVLFFFIGISIKRWVVKPIGLIAESLRKNDVSCLSRLNQSQTEFGRLSELVRNYLKQNDALETEIGYRKRAEEEAKKSEDKFRSLIAQIPDYIVVHRGKKILFTNKATQQVLGYTREELRQMDMINVIAEEDRGLVMKNISKRIKGEAIEDYEITLVGKQGQKRYVTIRGSAINYEGEPAIMNLLIDVTDRKNIVRELLQTKARQNAILDNMPYLAWLKDKEKRYVAVNRPFAEVYGQNPSFFSGKTDFDFCPQELAKKYNGEDDMVMQNGTHLYYQDERMNGAGRIFFEIFKKPIFDDEGEVIGVTGIERDITDQKLKQIELQKAKETAEKASNAKQQFLSIMSHEIRTPLNVIIGASNLLMIDDLNDEQQENVKLLDFSARHLLSLINDILDFAKIEAGKIEIQKQDFNLHDLVSNLNKTFNIRGEEKGLDILTVLDRDIPEFVKADQLRLNQILTNLLSNAVKFTEKGSVTLSLNKIKSDGNRVLIGFSVSDTGIGISPEKLRLIFSPFKQVHKRTNNEHPGTGLGLSITKKLVELQGGVIDVKSTPGSGTTFSFNLLLESSDHGEHKSVLEEQSDYAKLDGIKLLLVEDNVINQKIAGKFLSRWNAEIAVAGNGEIALDMLRSKEYDLILMDLQMPVMDGYETARRIRENKDEYYQNVPIIALTASAVLSVKDNVESLGMNDFVTKPFDPKELNRKIADHVRERLNVSL